LPGSISALSRITEQWEQSSLGVVSVAGYIQNLAARQHPFSFFFLAGKSSNQTEIRNLQNRKLLFDFRGLLPCPPPFGAALFSDERVIGAAFCPVTPLDDKNDTFLILPDEAVWKTRPNHQ